MTKSVASALNGLLRGISTGHVETVRDAWRALLCHGPVAVGPVREKLHSSAWTQAPRGPVAQYLAVLLAILAELDAGAFEAEIRRLHGDRLHSLHRRTVALLGGRLRDAPVARTDGGVPVHVAGGIADREAVAGHIARWSRTPGVSLDGLTRIDVIVRSPDLDYLGLYTLFFSGIILTWPEVPGRGLAGWAGRLRAELTFYHEVGHHAHGHVEGGVVASQEAEANIHAFVLFCRARPLLAGPALALARFLKQLLRARARARARAARSGVAGP